jgi:hypothetical protein
MGVRRAHRRNRPVNAASTSIPALQRLDPDGVAPGFANQGRDRVADVVGLPGREMNAAS